MQRCSVPFDASALEQTVESKEKRMKNLNRKMKKPKEKAERGVKDCRMRRL